MPQETRPQRGIKAPGCVLAAVIVLGLQGAIAQENAAQEAPAPLYGVAMHGDLKYGPDFTHFEYANPDAPKGGEMRLSDVGSFDTLNSFIVKGEPAPGLANLYQPLMSNADDEAFSQYGQIAESIEMPEDRNWVVFNLRKEARWNDGKPLTADDVVWTFDALMKDGHPFYRAYYANVKEAKAEGDHRVKFAFTMAGNRELPLIMSQMTILPRHYWQGRNFAATTLEPPVGSGPYKVKSVDPGRRIVYERVKDWWAKDLPVNKGQYNFDTLIYDAYHDDTVRLQAFFAGEYDFRLESSAKNWHAEYDNQVPVKRGYIKKVEIHHGLPSGMQGFAFNTRRDIFSDPKVRRALNYAFDFEWSNKQFAYGSYTRTASYFDNSELASSGLPQGRELELLENYRGLVPEEVFTQEYTNPKTSGSGQDMRANLGKAKALLEEAGWTVKDGRLQKNGKPFEFEILMYSDMFERWYAPFVANLKKLGITVKLRLVDTAQYQNRMDDFDFDMTVGSFGQSLSPGNEQRDFWGSDKADVKASRNIIGIKNPAIDDLIQIIITAKGRDDLVAAARALDRVLLWGHYLIPNWHIPYFRVAYWDKFGRPGVTPRYGHGIPHTWWFDGQKAAQVEARAKSGK